MKSLQIFLLSLFMLIANSVLASQVSNADPNITPDLKSDLPKLAKPQTNLSEQNQSSAKSSDTKSTEIKKEPLKGSVQHSEMVNPTNQFKGGADEGKLDGNAWKNHMRGKVDTNQQKAYGQADAGLGIIGVKFIMTYGHPPVINQVFPGTPADEVGLRPRDIIIAVDGVPTFGLSKDDVYNMIVGEPDTQVTISIRRNGDFLVQKVRRMDLNKIDDPYLRRDYLRM